MQKPKTKRQSSHGSSAKDCASRSVLLFTWCERGSKRMLWCIRFLPGYLPWFGVRATASLPFCCGRERPTRDCINPEIVFSADHMATTAPFRSFCVSRTWLGTSVFFPQALIANHMALRSERRRKMRESNLCCRHAEVPRTVLNHVRLRKRRTNGTNACALILHLILPLSL